MESFLSNQITARYEPAGRTRQKNLSSSSSCDTGKLKKQWIVGPIQPRNTISYWPKAENKLHGKIRKYMRRHMLKTLAGHMMWGGLGRPSPHSGFFTWPASIFKKLPPHVFSVFSAVYLFASL